MSGSHREAERLAAEWLSRRDGVEWSPSDQVELDAWLDESTAHAVAYIRLQAAWNRADRYQVLGAGFPRRHVPTPEQLSASPFFDEAGSDDDLAGQRVASSLLGELMAEGPPVGSASVQPKKTSRWQLRSLPRTSLAASIVFLALAMTFWYVKNSGTSYSTSVGGVVSIPLQDGSRMTLNTDSQVRLALTDKERGVVLVRGEAFFEIAKDPKRPFVVSAGGRRIVVVGTKFSVRRTEDDVRVAVTEGKVRMEDGSASSRASSTQTAGVAMEASEGVFVLEAGNVARAGGAGMLVQSKSLSELQETLSWRLPIEIFNLVSGAEQSVTNRNEVSKVVDL